MVRPELRRICRVPRTAAMGLPSVNTVLAINGAEMTDQLDRTNTALSTMLASLNWSCERLARTLNAYASANGIRDQVHAKTPYKWINGAHPGHPWPALVAAVLAEELGRPVRPRDLGWQSDDHLLVAASHELDLPWSGVGSLRALQVVAEAGRMDRRTFLVLLGTAATAPAHEWLIARVAQDLARPDGSSLPLGVVDDLDAIAARLRSMDDVLGGGSLLNLVGAQLGYVIGLIENRRYTETVGRRLHGSAAELLRLAGWVSFESGSHARAQRYWISALHAAHAAGDRAAGANILGFMSCQAKDLGHIREAVTLAETARAGYPGATPQVGSILDLRAAEAYANGGQPDACRRAIDDAFERLNGMPNSEGSPDWAYWLDETHAHGQAGYCYLVLHDWDRARTHLKTAIRTQTSDHSREAALRHALLATTYVQQQQPALDEAITYGSKALSALEADVDSPRCVNHVRRLGDRLRPYRRQADVRSFLDRIAALKASASR